jgi:hypothetical protein
VISSPCGCPTRGGCPATRPPNLRVGVGRECALGLQPPRLLVVERFLVRLLDRVVGMTRSILRRQGMNLPGQTGKRGCDLVDVGADVGGSGASAAVGVARVRAGDGVAEASFHPSQGRVSEPVGADLLCGSPGKVLSDSRPQVVVAAGRDRSAVPVLKQACVRPGSSGGGVVEQVARQGSARRVAIVSCRPSRGASRVTGLCPDRTGGGRARRRGGRLSRCVGAG